jgi:hypothetical protein
MGGLDMGFLNDYPQIRGGLDMGVHAIILK